jgi:hypothetical protein
MSSATCTKVGVGDPEVQVAFRSRNKHRRLPNGAPLLPYAFLDRLKLIPVVRFQTEPSGLPMQDIDDLIVQLKTP